MSPASFNSCRFHIVPTLQRGNAASDAPASRNAGALLHEFPRRSVGTINKVFYQPEKLRKVEDILSEIAVLDQQLMALEMGLVL